MFFLPEKLPPFSPLFFRPSAATRLRCGSSFFRSFSTAPCLREVSATPSSGEKSPKNRTIVPDSTRTGPRPPLRTCRGPFGTRSGSRSGLSGAASVFFAPGVTGADRYVCFPVSSVAQQQFCGGSYGVLRRKRAYFVFLKPRSRFPSTTYVGPHRRP